MDAETIFYISIPSVLILILLSALPRYGSFGIVVAILSLLSIILIFVINYADFLIFPAITQALGISVILANNYTAPKKQNCVIKYIGGIYYATGYLTANIYGYVFSAENIIEGEEAQLGSAPERWEKIVSNVKFPFKYNIISSAKDIQKYREELEGQRGFLEFQISRESNSTNPNQMTIEALRRRVSILQARIDRISTGERPLKSIMYMETTAVGVSEKEATDALELQLNQLETLFSSFDISMTRIIGREMHFLHRFNYRIYDFKNISSIFQDQK
jgi:hypothetical protein